MFAEDTVVPDAGGGGGNVGMAALLLVVIAPEVALGGAGDDVLQELLLRPWLVGALLVVVVAAAVAADPSSTRLSHGVFQKKSIVAVPPQVNQATHVGVLVVSWPHSRWWMVVPTTHSTNVVVRRPPCSFGENPLNKQNVF